MNKQDAHLEWLKCQQAVAYFVRRYLLIYDATAQDWRPFELWPAQVEPAVFAGYLATLGAWYNAADILPERNNHGHLLIRAL